MADFDFDELDKAVTGALSSTPDTTGTPSTGSTALPTTSHDDAPSSAVPSEAVPTPVQERSSTPPASRRSEGRFMDMVHPASAMRSSRPVAPRPVDTPRATPAVPPPEPTEIVSNPETSVASNPNDLAGVADVPKPLESPFLPDTKVEKRPLGGAGIVSSDAPESSPVVHQSNTTLDELLLEAPDEPKSEAPGMADPIDFAPQNDTPPFPAETVEAYHQPLPQPSKKKSGILVIVWILVLIAVGAGAGAAFYLYVLPLL